MPLQHVLHKRFEKTMTLMCQNTKNFQSLIKKNKPPHKAPTYLALFLNFSEESAGFKLVLHLTRVARVREAPSAAAWIVVEKPEMHPRQFRNAPDKMSFWVPRGVRYPHVTAAVMLSLLARSRGRQKMNPAGLDKTFAFQNFPALNWSN